MIAFIARIGGVAFAAGLGLSVAQAQAGYVVTLTQEGSDVVATGSGAIDPTGLTFLDTAQDRGAVVPKSATIITGPLSPDEYYTGFTGPTSFGSGFGATASSSSGDIVGVGFGFIGIDFLDLLSVPLGYVPNSALSDISTYDTQTFSSLGATPGTYEWTWGSGANQNFTLVIGEVPEPSTWAMMLLGFAGLGFSGYRRTRKPA